MNVDADDFNAAVQRLNGRPANPYEADVERHAERLRIQRAAQRRVEHEELSRSFVLPPSTQSLADELAIEEPPLAWTVGGLHPQGSNTLLSAAFKVGKTTMLANLLRSLVDGDPFLGEHIVNRPEGRVAYWNYEVSERQFRKWLRSLGIVNQDDAAVWHLRGHRLPLTVPFVEDLVVGWLVERNVSVLVLDPFSRAYQGEENSNTDVGRWLEALDVIKQRAGVTDLFMAAHFGRANQNEGHEHARGASRIDDWTDVRWLLTKGKDNGRRYFYADGRDVSLEECRLDFDPTTLRLYIDGGSRRDEREFVHVEEVVQQVVAIVTEQPGIHMGDLRSLIKGAATDLRNQAIAEAKRRALIFVKHEGRADRHYPGPRQ